MLYWDVLTTPAPKTTPKTVPTETIEEKINRISEQNGFASFATCIIVGDEIAWQHFYGKADIENNIDADDETIYAVASISKLVTATAVMQLVEDGTLDLDADINDYLNFSVRHPNAPNTPITTRMLLSHRSGLSSPASGSDPSFYNAFDRETAPDLGEWLETYLANSLAWISSTPGTTENYSNHGAALLGYIVERISGQNFNEYCKQNIFQPLGMTSTSFNLNDLNESKLAIPYGNGRQSQYSVPYYPATTLKTSIKDFSKFAIAYMHEGSYNGFELLKPETVNQMLTVQNSGSSLGILWWNYAGGWKGHAGAYVGSTTFMDINPLGSKRGVIMFINETNWLLPDANIIYPGGTLNTMIHTHASGL